ncbi:hypothetical protein [Sphingosinicella sp. BN140058]|uniref:hypothetical protein n=1 Tax=Sphingosinicella sp. BN140058 TaxID=1892855 RepID=UPI0010139616|nr:hypothetical protein [Sphingosinicella sp. BN140058]QAY78920.1 hypothetical protein ETR14_22055 [Sphingosinicella sp. BN140058]
MQLLWVQRGNNPMQVALVVAALATLGLSPGQEPDLAAWIAIEARSLHHQAALQDRVVATQTLGEILVHVAQCDEAVALLGADESLREGRIQSVVLEAVWKDDVVCAARLTDLQLTRPDTSLSPRYRARLNSEAGAVMLAADRLTEGTALIRQAENILTAAPAASAAGRADREALWSARYTMQWIYEGTPLYAPALEAHAKGLAAAPAEALPPTLAGFQVMFVGSDRKDLAEAVAKAAYVKGVRLELSVAETIDYPVPYRPEPPHCPEGVEPAPVHKGTLHLTMKGSDPLSGMGILMRAAQARTLTARCKLSGESPSISRRSSPADER